MARCEMAFRDDDDEEAENYRFAAERDKIDAADEGSIDSDFIRCPRCKKYCHSEAVSCPHCKHYLMEDEKNRKPMWFVVTVCFGVLVFGLPTLAGLIWIACLWLQR